MKASTKVVAATVAAIAATSLVHNVASATTLYNDDSPWEFEKEDWYSVTGNLYSSYSFDPATNQYSPAGNPESWNTTGGLKAGKVVYSGFGSGVRKFEAISDGDSRYKIYYKRASKNSAQMGPEWEVVYRDARPPSTATLDLKPYLDDTAYEYRAYASAPGLTYYHSQWGLGAPNVPTTPQLINEIPHANLVAGIRNDTNETITYYIVKKKKNSNPTVTLSTQNNLTLSKGEDLGFQWAGSDPDGDSLSYTLQIGKTSGASDVYNSNVGSATSKTGVTTFLDAGTYYWRVIASDGKGGVATSTEMTFNVVAGYIPWHTDFQIQQIHKELGSQISLEGATKQLIKKWYKEEKPPEVIDSIDFTKYRYKITNKSTVDLFLWYTIDGTQSATGYTLRPGESYVVDYSSNNNSITVRHQGYQRGMTKSFSIERESKTYTPKIPVSGITLDQNKLAFSDVGQTKKLSATVNPANATVKNVSWQSSDTSVAIVDPSGNVTSKGVGAAVITAIAVDGGKTATANVTVTTPSQQAQDKVNKDPSSVTPDDLRKIPLSDVIDENIDEYRDALKKYKDDIGRDLTPQDMQLVIDAVNAVKRMKENKNQTTVADAQRAVDKLQNGRLKTELQNEIDLVKVELATIAVEKAEQTKAQSDVDSARELVNALPEGQARTELNNRLDVVQKHTNDLPKATAAVERAEQTKQQSDVDDARGLVDALLDSQDKTNLSNRLDVVQTYIEAVAQATALVTKAEQTKAQSDVENARKLVDALPEGQARTELSNRLDAVQKYIDDLAEATAAVEKAEQTKVQSDVDSARELVNVLSEEQVRTELSNRLDVVQKHINDLPKATAAVEKAEQTKAQSDVDSARELVDALLEGKDRTELSNRLDAVQKYINGLTEATAAVEKAEQTKQQSDVDSARGLVNALPEGQVRTELSNRLDAVQKYIDDLATATAAVEKAEQTKEQSDVDSARTLVNALPDGKEKTELTKRLNAIQGFLDIPSLASQESTDRSIKLVAHPVDGATGYKIKRSDEDEVKEFVDTAFVDTTVLPGRAYTYEFWTVRGEIESEHNTVTYWTKPEQPTIKSSATDTSITLDIDIGDNPDDVIVEAKRENGNPIVTGKKVTEDGLEPKLDYVYQVRLKSANNEYTPWVSVNVKTSRTSSDIFQEEAEEITKSLQVTADGEINSKSGWIDVKGSTTTKKVTATVDGVSKEVTTDGVRFDNLQDNKEYQVSIRITDGTNEYTKNIQVKTPNRTPPKVESAYYKDGSLFMEVVTKNGLQK